MQKLATSHPVFLVFLFLLLTYLPGNTVSSVARAHGVAPAVLFRWRALDKQGALTAIQAGEATVSARKYEAALEEIKRLQRLLR